jgi:hypothetical protein
MTFSLDVARVFVVENESAGLAFPPMPGSVVVLGLGHAVSLIAAARWLADCEVHYWGDLDTHGFAMLDRLRASLPLARSLLMDRATLLAHRPLWTNEEAPYIASLDRLTTEEAALYADLRYDQLARRAPGAGAHLLRVAASRSRCTLTTGLAPYRGEEDGLWSISLDLTMDG